MIEERLQQQGTAVVVAAVEHLLLVPLEVKLALIEHGPIGFVADESLCHGDVVWVSGPDLLHCITATTCQLQKGAVGKVAPADGSRAQMGRFRGTTLRPTL